MASRWAKYRYRCLELWAIFGPSSYSFNPFVLNFVIPQICDAWRAPIPPGLFFFASSRHAMNTRDTLFPQSASPELVMTREPSTYGKYLLLHIHHMATSRSSPLYSKCLP
ncbi:unnamed protein product [Tuber melanosporum]|uniref:(Perigord truffle) hypothetical protein n=1 Tax=Tuber melanosporum (strain Mel28) TaxID=656061 RepID=D5GMV0_TUBMM|nr:uncharacterized protein GSTUM_00010947001 [Tuber melanosporum]CAZ85843.1 unnamed protein product [Tuber melanosporum]